VHATAQIKNPAYDQLRKLGLDLTIPFAWPYKVLLPTVADKSEHTVLARGTIQPFSISSSSKFFNVSLNGTVETSSNSSSSLSQSLSKFITHYLGGRSNRVYVAFDAESPFAQRIPAFLIPLIRDKIVANDIPGLPSDKRDLLKDLQMEHLRVHPSESGQGGFECDGEMTGRLIMPDGLDTLENAVNITPSGPISSYTTACHPKGPTTPSLRSLCLQTLLRDSRLETGRLPLRTSTRRTTLSCELQSRTSHCRY